MQGKEQLKYARDQMDIEQKDGVFAMWLHPLCYLAGVVWTENRNLL